MNLPRCQAKRALSAPYCSFYSRRWLIQFAVIADLWKLIELISRYSWQCPRRSINQRAPGSHVS